VFVPLDRADVADLAGSIRDPECSQAARMRLGTSFRSRPRFDEYIAARQSGRDLTFTSTFARLVGRSKSDSGSTRHVVSRLEDLAWSCQWFTQQSERRGPSTSACRGFEQFNEVAGRVGEQNLASARACDDIAVE
jgi:hypothetical protein